MKVKFWKTDWFAGLLLVLVFLFAARSDLMQSLERKAYDLGVQATARAPTGKVAVIAIDEQSIANLGRWPWPRDIQAKMIDILAAAHAKVVGNTVLLLEPQIDPGLAHIDRLLQFYSGSALKTATDEAVQRDAVLLDSKLHEAEDALNTDRKLGASIDRAGNVLLAMFFELREPQGKPDRPLPDYVLKNALASQLDKSAENMQPLPAAAAFAPIPAVGKFAAGIGYLNENPDNDGAIRTQPLVLRYYDRLFPSMAVMLAARSLNLQVSDIAVKPDAVRVGQLNIATDPALQMRTFFYKDRDGRPAFQVDSFYDVYTGKIPAAKYRDKIVLIGATAAGIGNTQVTPVSPAMPPVLTLAHSVSSILQQDFFVAPAWAAGAELGAFLLIALYLILLLPRLKAGVAAALTGLLFAALLAAHFALMTTQLMWLQLMLPAALLLTGHLLLTSKRFFMSEKGKLKSEAESAESNRMLGLAFQGQGQLDMAFEKLRKCPLDDSMMDLLYNLALDFERKRQFNKAAAVFQYMADFNPKFRDLPQRLKRSRAMEETVMLGGAGGGTNASLLMEDGGVEKPMLGRYQIEKELGKGAMGVVYQGRDPKISRVVAIKTMALSQEFDADELEEVRARFFREAETAGRLNHPNIVTIYDAGEEHDLAYIAMEFLQGRDLAPHTRKEQLLPLPKVLKIVAKVADALNYAHTQNVVHRDIKPANIMFEAETGSIKVTDFGIARITDSSRTKTGMVLGTPSYMSPEQLAGKKVDGRSDLFSLGVMFYQLLAGQLPFQGESMAGLMYQITNDPPRDILAFNPKLPACVVEIVMHMLQKQPEQRYQTGSEVVQAILACAKYLSAAAKGAK